jgi:phosphatidate cytidylyltransferase
MSMNWSVFRTRAITALFFVAIMMAGLLWNEWSFFVLFSVIHAGCWIEYHRLNEKILPQYTSLHSLFKAGLLLIGWGFCFYTYQTAIENIFFYNTGIILLTVGAMALAVGGFFSVKAGARSFIRASIGLIYISLSFGLLMHLRSGGIWINADSESTTALARSLALVAGKWIPLVLIGIIWINDTMAYLVGSFIGKTPLSQISPKKTWEGTIGGFILSVGVGFLCGYYIFNPESGKHFAVIALIASVTGTLGDLLESKLKRSAGVKDSGQFMPGHGGFLDRFDSLLLAAPFVWSYLWLVSL